MELSLRNQLIEAFEPEYFQDLRNSTTGMINNDIPIIITFLQSTYGQITAIEMVIMEHSLTATVFNTSRPVNFIFNNITKYAKLFDLNDSLINEKHKAQFMYVIFQKSGAYLDSFKTSNFRHSINKTYEEVKKL